MALVSPISGNIAAAAATVGPFVPTFNHPFNVSISGTFSGNVLLQRQFASDSTSTWRTLTTYTAPTEASTLEVESGVTYQFVGGVGWTSGTATCRFGQFV
jgi:hypothetical protein